jgi:tetratricopeptide (TPR) repeat protein
MLIVLDNARDADQVRPLLPGGPGCLVVVTSRSQLTSLVAAMGAHPVTLDVLSEADARELLARRLGPERIAGELERVTELTELCARLPLALAIAAARAAEAGFDTHAWQIPWTLVTFFVMRGNYHDLGVTQRTALAAARRCGDVAGQAHAHRALGRASIWVGRSDEAHASMSRALALFRELGDRIQQAHIYEDIGMVFDSEGKHRQALDHDRQAIELFRGASNRPGLANSLNTVGLDYAHLGDYQQALSHCQDALSLCCELGLRHEEAATRDSHGYAHHHLGHYRDATACYGRSVSLCCELGNPSGQADTLSHLADRHYANGNLQAAESTWRQALDILDGLHHPAADRVPPSLTAWRESRVTGSPKSLPRGPDLVRRTC